MSTSIHIPAGTGLAGASLYLSVDQTSVFASLTVARRVRGCLHIQDLAASSVQLRDCWAGRLRVTVLGTSLIVGAHYELGPAALAKAIDWLTAQGVEVDTVRMAPALAEAAA